MKNFSIGLLKFEKIVVPLHFQIANSPSPRLQAVISSLLGIF